MPRDSYVDVGPSSLDDHGEYDGPYESKNHEYHNDFSSEDGQVIQGANLGRRNSRFVLITRPPSDIGSLVPPLPGHIAGDDPLSDPYGEVDEEDDSLFINYSLLSHLATLLRDKVPRGIHVKGSIPYPNAFTGKDIVVSSLVCFANAMD